jgi:L-lactate utilization protein LutB
VLAVDPEHATIRRTLDGAARTTYLRAFERWLDERAAEFRAAGVRYLRADTSEPAAHLVRRIAGSATPTAAG